MPPEPRDEARSALLARPAPWLIPLLLCLQQFAWAQQAEQASSDVVDEIIVRGQKSLLRMRLEVYKAEDRFYEMFDEDRGADLAWGRLAPRSATRRQPDPRIYARRSRLESRIPRHEYPRLPVAWTGPGAVDGQPVLLTER